MSQLLQVTGGNKQERMVGFKLNEINNKRDKNLTSRVISELYGCNQVLDFMLMITIVIKVMFNSLFLW